MAWIRRVIGLVLAALGTVFGHAIWPISERLGEAATTEWINHQITEKYGIVSPSQKQVIDFAEKCFPRRAVFDALAAGREKSKPAAKRRSG